MVAALRARGIEAEIATSQEDAGASLGPCAESNEAEGVPMRLFPRWHAPLRPLQNYTFCPSFTAWLKQNIEGYDLLAHPRAFFPSAQHGPCVRETVAFPTSAVRLGCWDAGPCTRAP